MRSRPLNPCWAEAKSAIFRKNPLMRFFALSLVWAPVRFEHSNSNAGGYEKNLLSAPRSEDCFFSCGWHQR